MGIVLDTRNLSSLPFLHFHWTEGPFRGGAFLVGPTGQKLPLIPDADDEIVQKLRAVQKCPAVKVVPMDGRPNQLSLVTSRPVPCGGFLCSFGGQVVCANESRGDGGQSNTLELQVRGAKRADLAIDPSRYGNEARFANHAMDLSKVNAQLVGLPFLLQDRPILVPVILATGDLPAGTIIAIDYTSTMKSRRLQEYWPRVKWERQRPASHHCGDCSMNFWSASALTTHQRRCQTFSCSQCAQRFSSKDHTKRHERGHQDAIRSSNTFSKKRPRDAEPDSSVCMRTASPRTTPNPFKRPRASADPALPPSPPSLRRRCANQAARQITHASKAQLQTASPEVFQCLRCHKRFRRSDNLQRHTNTHKTKNKRQRFACERCTKSFLNKSTLTAHARCH